MVSLDIAESCAADHSVPRGEVMELPFAYAPHRPEFRVIFEPKPLVEGAA
jgi:hypothetical protein